MRPLATSDPALRDLITHTAKVRVAITDWKLLPYFPGAQPSDNHHGAGHWRLYLDGHSLGDNYGSALVSYTTYLAPGTHWIPPSSPIATTPASTRRSGQNPSSSASHL